MFSTGYIQESRGSSKSGSYASYFLVLPHLLHPPGITLAPADSHMQSSVGILRVTPLRHVSASPKTM